MYESIQIFLIAILLVMAYVIVKIKDSKNLKSNVKPVQVSIPTIVLIVAFFIINELKLIKNFFVKFVIIMLLYFIAYYLVKFLVEKIWNVKHEREN